MKTLDGKIAVVAGATRGAGRGIACALGDAGATVYCTGRSVCGRPATQGRPEAIEETAEMVSERGGVGIHVRVDHTVARQVHALFERIGGEQNGIDILVNDVWGGDALSEWGKPFWELDLDKGSLMLERAVWSHILTSRYGVPLMLPRSSGLVVEVTDGHTDDYRGNLFYDLSKMAAIRLARGMAEDLEGTTITAVALTPGFLRSQAMPDHFGVTQDNWRDAVEQDLHFIASETPTYIGRAVAALAAGPAVQGKAGQALATGHLAAEYGFRDADGSQPNWPRYYDAFRASQGS